MYTTFGFMYLLVLAFMSSRLEDDNGWSASTASLSFTLIGLGMVVGGPIIAKSVALFGTRATLATAFSLWSTLVILILPGWVVPTLLFRGYRDDLCVDPCDSHHVLRTECFPRGLRPWVQRSDSRFRGSPDDFSPNWRGPSLTGPQLFFGSSFVRRVRSSRNPRSVRSSKRSATPPTIALEPPTTQPLVAPSVFTVKPH